MISCIYPKREDVTEKNQPRRSQIYVGFQCHQKCGFCYYKSRCTEDMFPKEYVIRQIDLLMDYGINAIEITGGEPSECKHLRYYCEYIKQKNKDAKIAIITNGGLYNCNIWDIIDEVLISYHISNKVKNLDKAIFPLGSTYEKVKKTIQKANCHNVFVRTNTIIASFNLDDIDNIIDNLIEFKPSIVNLLPINLFDESYEMNKYIDYPQMRVVIKKCIDRLKETLHDNIRVRYFPLCDMEGYEKYIVGVYQHIYDEYDWNVELGGISILNLIDNNTNIEILEKLGVYGETSFQAAKEIREKFYEKDKKCLSCKNYIICDGVEKTKNHKLLDYIIPSKGKILKNILFHK